MKSGRRTGSQRHDDCITVSAALYAVPWQGARDQAENTVAVTAAAGVVDGKVGPKAGRTNQRRAVDGNATVLIGSMATTRLQPPGTIQTA